MVYWPGMLYILCRVEAAGRLGGGIVMCLGIPMQIRSIEGHMARCSAKGVERDVSLFMLQDNELAVDDFVVVHVGYAIQKITPEEAQSAWEMYDLMLEAPDA